MEQMLKDESRLWSCRFATFRELEKEAIERSRRHLELLGEVSDTRKTF